MRAYRSLLVMGTIPLLLSGGPVEGADSPKNDILFEHDGIFSMRADGSHRRRVTNNRDLDDEATWSPNGRRVAFSRYRTDTRNWDIWITTSTGVKPRRLTRSADSERDPVWSPDGKWIAYENALKGVFVVHPDGSGSKRLTPRGWRDSTPAWSPDSRKLAVLRKRRGSDDAEIHLIDPDGSALRQVTHLAGQVRFQIDWGKSGWIAFDYRPVKKRLCGPRILLIRPSGRAQHNVGRCGDAHPVFSPSGESLLVGPLNTGIFRMRRDGSQRTRLVPEGKPVDWIRR